MCVCSRQAPAATVSVAVLQGTAHECCALGRPCAGPADTFGEVLVQAMPIPAVPHLQACPSPRASRTDSCGTFSMIAGEKLVQSGVRLDRVPDTRSAGPGTASGIGSVAGPIVH
jgi:hypothetical protein